MADTQPWDNGSYASWLAKGDHQGIGGIFMIDVGQSHFLTNIIIIKS